MVDFEGENSVPNNGDTDSTTNLTDEDSAWMSLLVVADDDEDDDLVDYDEFYSNYDHDNEGVFDNDNTGQGEGYVCMTVTDSWLHLEEDKYEDDDILLRLGAFDVGGNPSIHPNFFSGTLKDGLVRPYINDDPISNTQVLHHTLLKSSV